MELKNSKLFIKFGYLGVCPPNQFPYFLYADIGFIDIILLSDTVKVATKFSRFDIYG